MRMLPTVLGALTAITLLSGCAYDGYDRYGSGYGNSYGYGSGSYYGDRYDRSYSYGGYDRNCYYDRAGYRHCGYR